MASIDHQIAALEGMKTPQLKEEWCRVTGTTVMPRLSPAMLRLALAWEIQAKGNGGHSRGALQTLAQIANAKTRTNKAGPGTRLIREWQGQVHIVTIDEDEVIRWQDREWRSLSEVARAITGTRWSGPAFFGLKRKVAA